MSFSCFRRWWLSGTKATKRSDMTGYPGDGVFLEKKSPWQKRDLIWCWMICFQERGSCAIRQEYRWSSMSMLRWETISSHDSEQCWKCCTLFRVRKGIFEVRDSGKHWRDAGFDQKSVRDSGKRWRNPGFDQKTVRDSGKRWRMRDLTASREAEFAKRHGCGLRKRIMFGIAMTEVRNAGFSWKRSRNAGSGIPVSNF